MGVLFRGMVERLVESDPRCTKDVLEACDGLRPCQKIKKITDSACIPLNDTPIVF